MAGFTEHHVTAADGLSLYFRDYPAVLQAGSSPRTPVLCLPGLTRNSRDFDQLASHLASDIGRRVLTLDFRGRGRSAYDEQWRNYRPEIYVRDVLALLDAVRLRSVVVIGTSLGGIVGMFLASAQRDRVTGLVLNDIGPELETAGMLRIAGSAGTARPVTSWLDAAADARLANAQAYPDFTEADWLDFAHRVYREDSPGCIVRDVDPNVGRALREPGGAPTGAVPGFWAAFDTLRGVPLLCLRGELSDLLSRETVAQMADRHGSMQSREIPRRGHAPTLDEPESREAVDAFLASL